MTTKLTRWLLVVVLGVGLACGVSQGQVAQALRSTGEFRVVGGLPGLDVSPPTGGVQPPPQAGNQGALPQTRNHYNYWLTLLGGVWLLWLGAVWQQRRRRRREIT